MIKLTTKDGEPYWVNPALMTGMFPQDGGTRLCFIFPDDTVPVKEKPEEVNQAIGRHEFEEIRYKEKLDSLYLRHWQIVDNNLYLQLSDEDFKNDTSIEMELYELRKILKKVTYG